MGMIGKSTYKKQESQSLNWLALLLF